MFYKWIEWNPGREGEEKERSKKSKDNKPEINLVNECYKFLRNHVDPSTPPPPQNAVALYKGHVLTLVDALMKSGFVFGDNCGVSTCFERRWGPCIWCLFLTSQMEDIQKELAERKELAEKKKICLVRNCSWPSYLIQLVLHIRKLKLQGKLQLRESKIWLMLLQQKLQIWLRKAIKYVFHLFWCQYFAGYLTLHCSY